MKLDYNENCDDLYYDTELTAHMEDYIEAIALLAKEHRVVRVKDIAKELKIKMPSVTAALNKLKEKNLIDYEKYGYIELTELGNVAAQGVFRRHTCLYDFFHTVLGLDAEEADKEACKVEHNLNPDTFKRIHLFLRFYMSEEKNSEKWINKLKEMLIQTK